MEKLLLATYRHDLAQLDICCYLLNLNWKGSHNLTIFVGSVPNDSNEQDINAVRDIVSKRFDNTWNVNVIDGNIDQIHQGNTEQCINKFIYSIDYNFTDTIVFDSKDFMLKTMDLSDFKVDGKYKVLYFLKNQKHVDVYPDFLNISLNDVEHIPATVNLTPWIWNNQELEKCWNHLNEQFGPYDQWEKKYWKYSDSANDEYVYEWLIPTGGDWDTYFGYIASKETDTNVNFAPDNKQLIVAGFWSHQTYEGGLLQKEQFLNNEHKKIWKHTRKVNDSRCIDITKEVLTHYNVPQDIIDPWYVFNQSLFETI